MNKIKIVGLLLAALLLTGCSGEKKVVVITNSLPSTTTTATTTEESTTTTEAAVIEETMTVMEAAETVAFEATPAAPSDTITAVGSNKAYYASSLSDTAWDFINQCVFVGDSICSGLKAYEILPAKNVLAVGNTAARNIFEDWVGFKVNGAEMDLISALKAKQPKYIVFSMGMNDVNMTTEAQFCVNYDNILAKVKKALPDAKCYIFSVTPVTYKDDGKIFTYNSTIDSFNTELRKHLKETDGATYIDVASELKDSNNLLRAEYLGSPDGVHLAPGAYYAILYQFVDQVFD